MIIIEILLNLILCVNLSVSDMREVFTNQGVVRGFNDDDPDVFSFYGIPYATAPNGADMFKDSLEPPTWTDVFNATDRYTICPQTLFVSDRYIELHRSLDCLNINVIVPRTNKTDLPVMFYIHGGAYVNGYGMQMSPVKLVKKGLIVVNFNYRLGVHGFLCLGTEFAPGNTGLKDQVKALKWTRDNIKYFGGDPDKITIGGSSAGSAAVELHLLSKMSKGMFSQAFCDSGSTLGDTATTDRPVDLAEEFANYFGVHTDNNVTLLESFFSQLSMEQLEQVASVDWIPCIEDHNIAGVQKFLTEFPLKTIDKGDWSKVPLLSGFTTSEGLLFLNKFDSYKIEMEKNFISFIPNSLKYQNADVLENYVRKIKNFYFPSGAITEEGFVHYFTDMFFIYTQYAFTRYHAQYVPAVFLHVFDFKGTVRLPDALVHETGSGHTVESLYVFDFDARSIYDNMTNRDLEIQEQMRQFYYNFCKYGNPSILKVKTWLPFSESRPYYMSITNNTELLEYPLRKNMELWDSILKYLPKITEDPEKSAAATIDFVPALLILNFILAQFFKM